MRVVCLLEPFCVNASESIHERRSYNVFWKALQERESLGSPILLESFWRRAMPGWPHFVNLRAPQKPQLLDSFHKKFRHGTSSLRFIYKRDVFACFGPSLANGPSKVSTNDRLWTYFAAVTLNARFTDERKRFEDFHGLLKIRDLGIFAMFHHLE